MGGRSSTLNLSACRHEDEMSETPHCETRVSDSRLSGRTTGIEGVDDARCVCASSINFFSINAADLEFVHDEVSSIHFNISSTIMTSFHQRIQLAARSFRWNFFRIHLANFTLIPLIFSGIVFAGNGGATGNASGSTDTGVRRVDYVDCLFLCYSAMT